MSIRDYSKYFKNGWNTEQTELSFFDPYNFVYTLNGNTPQVDDRYSPRALSLAFMSNPYAYGIYNKIQNLFISREYGFFGKSKAKNEAYKKLLDVSGFKERLMMGILPAFFGSGGGNGIYYTVKTNGKLKIKFDPFITSGFQRVQIVGDKNDERLEIREYQILDNKKTVLYKLNPSQVYRLQYSNPDGDYMFGTSPVVILAKYFMLKLRTVASNETIFKNGLQASYLVGLDANKMVQQGASKNAIENAEALIEKRLTESANLANRNSFIYTGVPMTMEKIQLSNVEMETLKLMDWVNSETAAAYGVDPSILNISNSKYDNGEIALDDLYKSIHSHIKRIVDAETEYVMPRLDPQYDPAKYPFRMAYEPTQEAMQLKKMKQDDLDIFLNFWLKAKELGLEAKPTPDKVRELQELGIDISYETAPSSVPQSPTDFLQIADTFTNETQPENFNKRSTDIKLFDEIQKREVEQDILDETFEKYYSLVNMSASELEEWSNNPKSKLASVDRTPILRNLELLKTKKEDWTNKHITWANKTISYISRAKSMGKGVVTKDSKPYGRNEIALMNWAYKLPTRNFLDSVKVRFDKSFKQVLHVA